VPACRRHSSATLVSAGMNLGVGWVWVAQMAQNDRIKRPGRDRAPKAVSGLTLSKGVSRIEALPLPFPLRVGGEGIFLRRVNHGLQSRAGRERPANVGREMLTFSTERKFPADEVVALASRRSMGVEVSYGDRTLKVKALEHYDFSDVDICLMSAGRRGVEGDGRRRSAPPARS